jgi:hypothetical protein
VNTFTFSYPKYLSAKEEVDEKALNERVLRRFLDELCQRTDGRPQILEVGGGTGAMLRRLMSRLEDTPKQELEYTLVEERKSNVDAAQSALRAWAQRNEYDLQKEGSYHYLLQNSQLDRIRVEFLVGDFFEYAARREERFDAIIAQAVLDLVDLGRTFQDLRALLRDRGLWYLPMHFDGLTAFEPSIDPSVDQSILRSYHKSMAQPQTGRRILSTLREGKSSLLKVGSSDWIVHSEETRYTDKEEYFLRSILQFIHDEIRQFAEISDDVLDEWIHRRKQQLEAGNLIYLAHQIDTCAEYKRA